MHISWSNSGLELVVVDVVGNLSVYTMFVAVNSYSLAGSFQWEQGEALGPIIGLEWLSINRVVRVLPMHLSQRTEWCLRRALSLASTKDITLHFYGLPLIFFASYIR